MAAIGTTAFVTCSLAGLFGIVATGGYMVRSSLATPSDPAYSCEMARQHWAASAGLHNTGIPSRTAIPVPSFTCPVNTLHTQISEPK